MNLPSESTHDAFQVDFARAVCRQLRLILECMRIEFPWLKNMAYDLSVCCPVCCASRSVNHCCNHNVRDCKEEQCLHLLSESQLLASRGSIVCTRSVVALNCKVPVDSVGFWFGSLEGQVMYTNEPVPIVPDFFLSITSSFPAPKKGRDILGIQLL